MPQKNDRRVRKTRGLLRQALVQLMNEKSIQEITVTQLCEVCDINRGTFYLHYTDVYDLLNSIEQEMLNDFENVLRQLVPEEIVGQETPSAAMRSLFEFLAANADMCKVLLCNNGDMAFVEKVKGIVEVRIMNKWSDQFERAGYAEKDYVFAFVVSGCMGMLQYWLENNMPLSPLEMAATMERILARGLTVLQ